MYWDLTNVRIQDWYQQLRILIRQHESTLKNVVKRTNQRVDIPIIKEWKKMLQVDAVNVAKQS